MARDDLLYFRKASAGNLTATSSGDDIDLGADDQIPLRGAVVEITVPAIVAAGDKIVATVLESSDDSTYRTFYTFPDITGSAAAPKTYRARVHTSKRYLRVTLTVTGTAPNFGAVTAVLINGTHFND